jgi:hypothetical protein
MRFGIWKWCVPKESWERYACLATSVSRSDNQPSIQRGFRAWVRGRQGRSPGSKLFGCTQMASSALVMSRGSGSSPLVGSLFYLQKPYKGQASDTNIGGFVSSRLSQSLIYAISSVP